MTTPSMLLTRWMGRGFLMVGSIVLTTFLVSITYEMHAEYNRQLIQRLEDEYLFEKCEVAPSLPCRGGVGVYF